MNTKPPESIVNASESELKKFGDLAHRWWDPQGPQRALHELNPTRLAYMRARCTLRGAAVLDLGCGAGLLSEALAGDGAHVTALDLAPELIEIARLHLLETQAAQPALRVDYRVQSVEALAAETSLCFDAIACMEMLEHVPDPASVVRACATLLKPGGRLFVSTLNRTPAAFALAIVGAEYITRLLPMGTHNYAQFIRPAELAAWLRISGLQLEDVSGLLYNPLARSAKLGRRTDVNYLVCAIKPT
ncbi:MAG TPA: bifunctional 2-polyprenyl-6-hydroxyphenol methylase/3-demethylubiquinol 3-O-methyltransferase UbiG [Xanthomonadaceae bacterium]|jgi:2-polyprenyl-6-hydroxyphenyl methylase/3-demethylubiquinone-9 3-methyltransferase|nr:bifunctional 2-polyprenyl-6-hydroxyphenol methylase/3-demethylubiquinol 3-O-methyltransferase UbiG [Xanthomonadaceae bacterium]